MASLPYPLADAQQDAMFATRMARYDGCPGCVQNYTLPRAVLALEGSGFVASYCCEDCGHHWITSWEDER